MELSEREALVNSLAQWRELAVSGKDNKLSTHITAHGDVHLVNGCFLCEYCNQNWSGDGSWQYRDPETHIIVCPMCPYYKYFGFCQQEGKPFGDWFKVKGTDDRSVAQRKMYATIFATELQAILLILDMEQSGKLAVNYAKPVLPDDSQSAGWWYLVGLHHSCSEDGSSGSYLLRGSEEGAILEIVRLLKSGCKPIDISVFKAYSMDVTVNTEPKVTIHN